MDYLKAFTQHQLRDDIPDYGIGDTLRIYVKIKEGVRERIQMFEGTLIAERHGGIQKTITVRRISYGIGVERTFPVNSPNIAKIEIARRGRVRRAKLFYLRDRVGKAAKVRQKL